jgi:hypothetical protein
MYLALLLLLQAPLQHHHLSPEHGLGAAVALLLLFRCCAMTAAVFHQRHAAQLLHQHRSKPAADHLCHPTPVAADAAA